MTASTATMTTTLAALAPARRRWRPLPAARFVKSDMHPVFATSLPGSPAGERQGAFRGGRRELGPGTGPQPNSTDGPGVPDEHRDPGRRAAGISGLVPLTAPRALPCALDMSAAAFRAAGG